MCLNYKQFVSKNVSLIVKLYAETLHMNGLTKYSKRLLFGNNALALNFVWSYSSSMKALRRLWSEITGSLEILGSVMNLHLLIVLQLCNPCLFSKKSISWPYRRNKIIKKMNTSQKILTRNFAGMPLWTYILSSRKCLIFNILMRLSLYHTISRRRIQIRNINRKKNPK